MSRRALAACALFALAAWSAFLWSGASAVRAERLVPVTQAEIQSVRITEGVRSIDLSFASGAWTDGARTGELAAGARTGELAAGATAALLWSLTTLELEPARAAIERGAAGLDSPTRVLAVQTTRGLWRLAIGAPASLPGHTWIQVEHGGAVHAGALPTSGLSALTIPISAFRGAAAAAKVPPAEDTPADAPPFADAAVAADAAADAPRAADAAVASDVAANAPRAADAAVAADVAADAPRAADAAVAADAPRAADAAVAADVAADAPRAADAAPFAEAVLSLDPVRLETISVTHGMRRRTWRRGASLSEWTDDETGRPGSPAAFQALAALLADVRGAPGDASAQRVTDSISFQVGLAPTPLAPQTRETWEFGALRGRASCAIEVSAPVLRSSAVPAATCAALFDPALSSAPAPR